MKTRFGSNKELAHVWAQQKQTDGRANNMFFDGASIFSYGRHFEIARFVRPDVVLLNDDTYSPSTNKHQSYTRRAISHIKTFSVGSMTDHNENAAAMVATVKREIDEIKRKHFIEWPYKSIVDTAAVALDYINTFKKEVNAANKKAVRGLDKFIKKELPAAWIEKKLEREKVLVAAANVRRDEKRKRDAAAWELQRIEMEKRRAEELIREQEDLAKWLNGEDVRSYFGGPIQLRIKGDEIQTTGGANVPLIEARKFWHALQRRENVVGMRLGHYTVDELDGDTLRVGCHNIPVREVVRMARALKWNDGITLEAVQ